MKKIISIILFLTSIGIIFFSNFYFKKDFNNRSESELLKENENLRAELQIAKAGFSKISSGKNIEAKIISTYPFNNKNLITLNLGEKDGIKKYNFVSWGDNILIGQISEFSGDFSLARTVFDPNWQIPVRIGEQEIDGLLQGGSVPQVTLIPKDKEVKANDIVFAAGSDLPYGIKIGEVGEIRETTSGVFKEAILNLPYNISDLRTVLISK